MQIIPRTPITILTITPQKTNSLSITFHWEAIKANAVWYTARTSNSATQLTFIDQNRLPTI